MSLAGSNRKPALTAAARRIAFSRQTADKLKEESWQERAWAVYGNLPEVFYMTRYRSDVASKIEYFVATIDDPGSDPDFDENGAGTKVLEAEGGPALLRRIVSELIVHWDIPGEAYLTRFDEAPLWRVLSTQELKKHGNRFAWGDEANDMGSIEQDQVFRVWDPHPRFHWQADSPTRHVLDNAEELILLTREAKASSMSRVSAGLFVLPDSIDLSPFADDEDGTPDDVARWLVDVLAKPISDPGSSSSVVPAVMTMHGDDITKIRHITFARDWEINLELRRELLRSVAAGLDLPPEILTGMADLNHWTAWQVSEQAVSQHVLPSVDAILDSLTTNWFRPLLEASGIDPDGYVLWRDPSPATVSPDQSDVAIRMYEQDAISGEALRRVTNFDEEDAPTPEELEDKTARRSASGQGVPTDGPPVQSAIDPDDALRFFELLDRNPRLADLLQQAFVKEGDPPLARAAVTAAARRRIVATELAEIDAEILTWVQAQADLEIERLTKLALNAAVDPLDESLLDGLGELLDPQIAQAQAAARGWAENLLGRPIDAASEAVARAEGIEAIKRGVLESVRRSLFTPGAKPDPIEIGAIGNITTPTQAIRHGLSLAGGGPAVFEDGKAVELIGNGQHVHDELAEDGFFQDGYVWKYGHPANTFEPHLHLDGKQFTSWDDPQLAVNFGDSWLRRSHYAPGDHKGCCCAFIQVIIEPMRDVGIPGEVQPTTGGEFNMSTDGMSPEEAADYMKTRRELIAKYPEFGAKVKHWGTGEDAGSRAALRGELLKDRARWEAQKAANPGVNVESLTASARIKHIDRSIELVDSGDFMAAFDNQYGGTFNGVFLNGDTIIVRPGVARPIPNPDGLSFKVDVPEGWSGTRYTATHEFGHVIEHDLLELGDHTPLAATTEAPKGALAFQDAIARAGNSGKEISGYGASNAHEGFAEMFVSNEVGSNPAMQRLLALSDKAESWPRWNATRTEDLMSLDEWTQILDEIGPASFAGRFIP